MTSLTLRQRTALRALAVMASIPILAQVLDARGACAQTPAPAVAAPAGAVKLFPDSRIVTRDRISVEVVGRGPDIVLIPGLASSRETWRRTAERLRGRYRLHLVNIAGFAGEPARANATGPVFDPTLEDIAGYIADAKLGRPLVIGHSLGGTLGLALAERHPERLSRLLVVDALPFYGVLMGGPAATVEQVRPIAEQMTKGMGGGMPEDRRRKMIEAMVTAPADVDRVVAWGRDSDGHVVATAMHDDILTDLRPGLAATRTPITVLYPFDPKLGPTLEMYQALYEGGFKPLPNGKVIRVDASRHFIMYDQPARFDGEVDAFLKG